MSRKLTAHAPVFQILAALRRAGWGQLKGAKYRVHRVILDTLVSVSRSQNQDLAGTFTITATQLADQASYSERHVRTALQDLDSWGIITWHRGGIFEGAPKPGWLRINKKTLVDMVHAARPEYDRELNRRRRETRARLEQFRLNTFCEPMRKNTPSPRAPEKPRNRRKTPNPLTGKTHAEMVSSLSHNWRTGREAGPIHPQKDYVYAPAVDTATIYDLGESTMKTTYITYQAYMEEHYPNQRLDWPQICDRDPIAYEVMTRGAVTPRELKTIEREIKGSQLAFEVA